MRNNGRFDFLRFPRNARGFLYYHHDPELPPTAGEIRFRLTTDSDVAGFKSGGDLVGPYGVPWAINLAVLTRPCYEAVRKRLLEDGLIEPGLMRNILEGWGRKYTNGHGICLHYLEQPFPAQLSPELYLRIFTPHAIGTVRRRLRSPYPGGVLLRFERSTLPEHAGTRTVVLRVLKIFEPLKAVIPGHDMRIPEPKEGDLLQTRSYGGLIRPFSINLDKPAKTVKDIGLLYPQVCGVYVLEAPAV
ncbi:hypothetical protein LshimejAT787_0505830 [Lyophyllum shimeji]|uniref:Uncharacterized protein n=1 Tax=Lyophyllum shimeji TaxID=47721 RepID=A0A9P3PNK1_LYOSH|nr:hypothetical protein LshimejAT787_0505830 [Lyophyllum shimeji]